MMAQVLFIFHEPRVAQHPLPVNTSPDVFFRTFDLNLSPIESMVSLSLPQIRALNHAILEIYQPSTLTHLNRMLFTTARGLIGHEAACTALVHGQSKNVDIFYNRPVERILAEFAPLIPEVYKMPGMIDGKVFDSKVPASLRDYNSTREWEHSVIYQHLHRPMEVAHDITLHFYRYAGGKSCHLSLFRKQRAFDPAERQMLELLIPHLHQRYQQLLSAEPHHPVFSSAGSLTERTWLVCNDAGRILRHSADLANVMNNVGLQLRDRLPIRWREWLKQQLTPPDLTTVPQPLVVSGQNTRMVVHALTNHFSQEHRLTLTLTTNFSKGLTRRENEIARWLSQGKSNAEIGEILSISPNTVRTHVERVLKKLNVENRTAAALFLSHSSRMLSVR
jgi:DNA-binding CsgD family transcriptional regulator